MENYIYLMCSLFCKSLYVINVGSPYGLGDPIYIYSFDEMWLFGLKSKFFQHIIIFFMKSIRIIIQIHLNQYKWMKKSSNYCLYYSVNNIFSKLMN